MAPPPALRRSCGGLAAGRAPAALCPGAGSVAGDCTIAGMDLLSVAKPWAYWIAPMILVGSVLAVLAYILMYVFKVVAAKYPKT